MRAALQRCSFVTLLLALAAQPGRAQVGDTAPAMKSLRDSVYSAAQAERGRRVFEQACSECHQSKEFTGPGYLDAWTGQTVHALFDAIRTTMPYDNPGRLSRRRYADVLAYIFSLNGLPAGEAEMKSDVRALKQIRIEIPARAN